MHQCFSAVARRRTHPVCVDGNVYHHVNEVSQSEAGDEGVWPTSHALVDIYDFQEGRIAHDSNDKHEQRHRRVDVLEGTSDSSRLGAHGWLLRFGRVN